MPGGKFATKLYLYIMFLKFIGFLNEIPYTAGAMNSLSEFIGGRTSGK